MHEIPSAFVFAPFSCPELVDIPDIFRSNPDDLRRLEEGLRAASATEIAKAALLWDDWITVKYVYRCPFLLVKVANFRAVHGSMATALLLYLEAQKLLGVGRDMEFDAFVANQQTQCAATAESVVANWKANADADGVRQWVPTPRLPKPDRAPQYPPATELLRERWIALDVLDPEIKRRYLRLCAVETYRVDAVFTLTSTSHAKLIKDGYAKEHVEIGLDSGLRKRRLIAEVIRDADSTLRYTSTIVADLSTLTPAAVRRAHEILMATGRILPIHDRSSHGDQSVVRYSNSGMTRQATQKNLEQIGPPRVQFCCFDQVDKELESILYVARQWIKNFRNPLSVAAWLHLVLTACHPFEDGNHRLSRIICSIPLMGADLPPLCIPEEMQSKYIAALNKAREGQLEVLQNIFLEAMELSLDYVSGL